MNNRYLSRLTPPSTNTNITAAFPHVPDVSLSFSSVKDGAGMN